MSEEQQKYDTLSWEPEVVAAALRVLILDDEKSGIDKLEPWVRFRIAEAADVLDRCVKNLEALERYVELIQEADREAFKELCESTNHPSEETT
jgi:hypothetical protein